MTNDQLSQFFANRKLPTGHVRWCAWESTDDLAALVAGNLDRLQRGGEAAATARGTLGRVVAWLEGQG